MNSSQPSYGFSEFTYSYEQVKQLRAIFDRRKAEGCQVPYWAALMEFAPDETDANDLLQWLDILERCNQFSSVEDYWKSFQ